MANFKWNNTLLGNAQRFWVFVEDAVTNIILHYEQFILTKKIVNKYFFYKNVLIFIKALSGDPQRLMFTIPVNEGEIQHQYLLRVASDEFVVGKFFCFFQIFKKLDDTVIALSLEKSILPTAIKPHTGEEINHD